MRMNKFVLGSFALISLFAKTSVSAEISATLQSTSNRIEIRGSTFVLKEVASKNRSVVEGQILSGQWDIDSQFGCSDTVSKLQKTYLVEIDKEKLFADWALMCIPNGPTNVLVVQIVVENRSDETLSTIRDYMAAHKIHRLFGIELKFEKLLGMEGDQKIYATHYVSEESNEFDFRDGIAGYHFAVSSYGEYLLERDVEYKAVRFRTSLKPFSKYVQEHYSAADASRFLNEIMPQGNWLDTEVTETIRTVEREFSGAWRLGFLRDCRAFDGGNCKIH